MIDHENEEEDDFNYCEHAYVDDMDVCEDCGAQLEPEEEEE
jgi:hypothetical protein